MTQKAARDPNDLLTKLKSWAIEVSNDGTKNSRVTIDRRKNNNDSNNSPVTVNFKISHVPSETFYFFRLRQTGKNDTGSDCLACSLMEIFATILDEWHQITFKSFPCRDRLFVTV